MHTHFLSKLSYVLIALLAIASGGCALVAVGAGGAAGYAYATGKQEKLYPYSLDQTWSAVREAVEEMKLLPNIARADALSARFESQLATGEKVRITLEPKSDQLTEVAIRIGVFGDHAACHLLFDKIDARLPGPYPLPEPLPEAHVGVSVSR